MKEERTFNTLFMLCSVDGKISTGDIDKRDIDKDFPKINGLKEGLQQYYFLEKQTDLHSFNTGRVMAKVGINKPQKEIKKLPVSFIIVDDKHLNNTGVKNLLIKSKTLYLVTSNKKHPAFEVKTDNLKIIFYKKIDFLNLFKKLKQEFGIDKVTIQSGGTLNSVLVREGLIDRISIVVAPALIGGKSTPTLVDGKSLRSDKELKKIKALRFLKCDVLGNSYLHLIYDV
ncbi:MAG: dihydrofolate reductase family protein, partial [Candidatus Aenigmatarchaeota archaeon]